MVLMTASEVSRNFASVLDRAAHGETIVVTRGGKRLATIAPAPAANGAALADFLAEHQGTLDDSFAEDVLGARDLLTQGDPWSE
jgi:prevent-host-death family protein